MRTETDRLGQGCRNVNSLTNSRAAEPNSQTENGKEVGGSEDERESGYDSIDPLRDVNTTELSASTLIMRDGANRCNMGYENVRKSWSGDGEKEWERKEREKVKRGRIPDHDPGGREYGRGEGVKAEKEKVICKSRKERD